MNDYLSNWYQELLSFEDVTVDLTLDEWTSLDPSQRKLYSDVMLENFQNLAAVGCELLKPSLVSWLEKEELRMREGSALEEWKVGPKTKTKGSTFHQDFLRGQTSREVFMVESHNGAELCDFKYCGDTISGHQALNSNMALENKGNTSEHYQYGIDVLPLGKEISTREKLSMSNQCEPTFSQPPAVLYPRRCPQDQLFVASDYRQVFVDQSDVQNDSRIQSGNKLHELNERRIDFLHSNSLAVVMQTQDGEKSYEDKDCGKDFRYSAYLNIHMGAHNGQNPYECKQCGMVFTTSSQCDEHVKSHTVEKLLECKLCGKSFRNSSCLHDHFQIHSGIKPFKCMDCGKAFIQNAELTKHIRIHTGERPYKCKECGKAFARSSRLKEHMRTHTGEKPFECVKCGKAFAISSNLSKHLRIHTGEKPFKCKECGKAFTHSSGLNHHIQTHSAKKSYMSGMWESFPHVLPIRPDPILEKNHVNVNNVGNPSGIPIYFSYMKELTLERSSMNIRSVGKPSVL